MARQSPILPKDKGRVRKTMEGFIQAIREINAATANAIKSGFKLDDLLQEIVDLGLGYATISVVDKYMYTITTVKGIHVPPGWIRRSKYSLKSKPKHDVLVEVYHTGEMIRTPNLEDFRLNPDIYNRYEHKDLERIFFPIHNKNPETGEKLGVVGVVEVGCSHENAPSVLTEQNIEEITNLLNKYASHIGNSRTYLLLELIAEKAKQVMAANSATIHVYSYTEKKGMKNAREEIFKASNSELHPLWLTKYPPRENGIGAEAIEKKKILIRSGPDLKKFSSLLNGTDVNLLVALPLLVNKKCKGILYLHYLNNKNGLPKIEEEAAEIFASLASAVIQNTLLFKTIARGTERLRTISQLQNVLSLPAALDYKDTVQSICKKVMLALDADLITLYIYHSQRNELVMPPWMEGDFKKKQAMKLKEVSSDNIVLNIINDGINLFYEDADNEARYTERMESSTNETRFVIREEIKSSAALLLRNRNDGIIFGVLFVNFRDKRRFKNGDRIPFEAIAMSVAMAIERYLQGQHSQKILKRKCEELDSLKTIEAAFAKPDPKPNFLLQRHLDCIIAQACKVIDAPYGHVVWLNGWTKLLELEAYLGIPKECRHATQGLDSGIIGLAASERRPILVPDVRTGPYKGRYLKAIDSTRCELAVPIISGETLLGVINLEHDKVAAFDAEDQAYLEVIALMMATAAGRISIQRDQLKAQELLAAHSLMANRMHKYGDSPERLAAIFLTGLTSGGGFGYSRAMLFLMEDTLLKGYAAIGAVNEKAAKLIWEGLNSVQISKELSSLDRLGEELDTAVNAVSEVEKTSIFSSQFSNRVKNIQWIPHKKDTSIGRCLDERRIVVTESGDHDSDVAKFEEKDLILSSAFASIPLFYNDKCLGVVLVDNSFLPSERAIDTKNLDILDLSAAHFSEKLFLSTSSNNH
jgi:GAF domain-containing protein/ribosomal protein L23